MISLKISLTIWLLIILMSRIKSPPMWYKVITALLMLPATIWYIVAVWTLSNECL